MSKAKVTEMLPLETQDLTVVASLIQPLPETVAPSEEFLDRMRRHLLEMKSASGKPSMKAA